MTRKFVVSDPVSVVGTDGKPKISGGIITGFNSESNAYSVTVKGRLNEFTFSLPEERLIKAIP